MVKYEKLLRILIKFPNPRIIAKLFFKSGKKYIATCSQPASWVFPAICHSNMAEERKKRVHDLLEHNLRKTNFGFVQNYS